MLVSLLRHLHEDTAQQKCRGAIRTRRAGGLSGCASQQPQQQERLPPPTDLSKDVAFFLQELVAIDLTTRVALCKDVKTRWMPLHKRRMSAPTA